MTGDAHMRGGSLHMREVASSQSHAKVPGIG